MINFYKFEQILNELSPDLYDRAAKAAYAQGDEYLHDRFMKAKRDRKYPGEDGWEHKFNMEYLRLYEICSSDLQLLKENKHASKDQKLRCHKFALELKDFLDSKRPYFNL